jgi:hypothetical protein
MVSRDINEKANLRNAMAAMSVNSANSSSRDAYASPHDRGQAPGQSQYEPYSPQQPAHVYQQQEHQQQQRPAMSPHHHPVPQQSHSSFSPSPQQAPVRPTPRAAPAQIADPTAALTDIFVDYSKKISNGSFAMEGNKFIKLCKDAYLYDALFKPEDVDVVFAKFKEPGQRHLSYKGFVNTLSYVAAKKRISTDEIINHVIHMNPSALRPNAPVTVAQPTRFHDDMNAYTGVHKAGGPTTIDHNHKVLSSMVERS